MNFADIKLRARRAVHKTLAVPCFYRGPGGLAEVAITARLHDRIVQGGDLNGAYATIIEGVTRAVFDREELTKLGVTLRKRGRVRFPDYGVTLELDVRDAFDGPITEKWSVAPV